MRSIRTPRPLPMALGLAASAAMIVMVALVVTDPLDRLDRDDPTELEVSRGQSRIENAALTAAIETDGDLLFEQQRTALAVGPGTITGVIEPGSDVEAGSVLFEVDGEASVALIGAVPAWRSLSVGDVGVDVEQLETALVGLGYDPDELLAVDETYSDATATVVERWQTDLGREPTGSVEWGSVVFIPSDATVTSTTVALGDALGAEATPAVELSSGSRRVVFAVPAEHLASIETETTVVARLPDRSEVTVVVDHVGPSGGGNWTASATIADGTDPVSLPDGEAVPVTVSWTDVVSTETTTVQASALTRLDTGVYVIEIVEGDGPDTRFAEVEIGPSVGSMVAIVTDLPPGTAIIDP